MTDYSQSGEQELILKHFQGMMEPGLFLDVGAGDGMTGSNTRALYEMGWEGILVEPNPAMFVKLVENCRFPTVTLINAAIAPQTGLTKFYINETPGWCSLDERWVKEKEGFHETEVLGITFQDIRLPHGIDFMSVDAEGTDAAIIQSLPDYVRPSLIVAECDKFDNAERIDSCLISRGYTKAWSTLGNVAYRFINE